MNEAAAPPNKLTIRQFAKTRFFWGGLAVLGVLGASITGFLIFNATTSESDQSLKEVPLPVKVVEARTVTSVNYGRNLTGVIRARRTSELAFERTARISKVHFDDGDTVKENQVLAELDTRDLVIAQRQVAAEIENAQAVLDELEAGPRKEVIESAKADVAALRAELNLAEEIKQRRDTLRRTNAISNEEWENAQSRLNAASARYNSAEKKLEELEAGIRIEKKSAQAAVVKQLETRLAQVKLDLEKSKLRAPFSGKVASRFLDEGVVVPPGTPVLKVTESDSIEAIVGIPPGSLKSLSRTAEYPCEVGTLQTKATLLRILPETDPKTRTIPVVFKLAHNDLIPGQIIRIRMNEQRKKRGTWVPTAALIPASKGLWSLFVVTPSESSAETGSPNSTKRWIAETRPVEVIFNDGNRSLVRGPIADGEKIVSEGAQRINNGQAVSIASSN